MRLLFTLLTLLLILPLRAQLGKQKNLQRYYTFEEVYDSTTGIDIYERLNFPMGGDSTRNTPKGYAASGTWEDYYRSGAVLHTGYYMEGQLRSYKNFYENGQTEREFKTLDYFRYQMTLWWPNGKLRSDIIYFQGQEEATHEYYENGNPEFAEEYAKKCEYMMFRTFYFESGKVQSDLRLADKKKKKYSLKEYFENGTLQAEGTMQYYEEIDNYMKEGTWKVYDESGKQIAVQEYVRGQMTEEKKIP